MPEVLLTDLQEQRQIASAAVEGMTDGDCSSDTEKRQTCSGGLLHPAAKQTCIKEIGIEDV